MPESYLDTGNVTQGLVLTQQALHLWTHLSSPCTSQFKCKYRQFTFQSTSRAPTYRRGCNFLEPQLLSCQGTFWPTMFVGDVYIQSNAMCSLRSLVLFLWEGHISKPIRQAVDGATMVVQSFQMVSRHLAAM